MSTVTVKSKELKKKVTVEYKFPSTIADAISMYGEDIVFNRFYRQISQELRASVIRAMTTAAKAKKSVEAAANEAAATFSPEVNTHATRAIKSIDKALGNLSNEERSLVLKALNTVEADVGGQGELFPSASASA